MKERPILFSATMVRAILSGAKTQTRRIVKLTDAGRVREVGSHRNWHLGDPAAVLACPYGQPGDRLWVRETWRPRISHACAMDACDCADVAVDYVADGAGRWFSDYQIAPDWLMPKAAARGNVSPLFMPRWASRITLEITGVRVKRLNDINEADAIAEGVTAVSSGGVTLFTTTGVNCFQTAKDAYAALWESINGPGSWEANPWVWVVEFRRVAA